MVMVKKDHGSGLFDFYGILFFLLSKCGAFICDKPLLEYVLSASTG